MKLFISIIVIYFISLSPASAKESFLTFKDAFALQAEVVDNTVVVQFDLAEDIYVYKDRVSIKLAKSEDIKLGRYILPKGSEHDGDFVYTDGQVVKIPLVKSSDKSGLEPFELSVSYQGCSRKGLCYEPKTTTFMLEANLGKLKKVALSEPFKVKKSLQKESKNEAVFSEDDPIKALLVEGKLLYIIGGFFIFGLLLSLTPCVFPMLPILSSVIVSHGSNITTKKAFLLSMVYVQSMAITYTVAGVVAGLSGAGVQAAFQTPWVISLFAIIFVILSLSMFGLFEIQMPHSVQNYLNKKSKNTRRGGYFSVAIMGLLSALIVGPCVAAPLAAALGFISQTGDAFLGGVALYALSIGMGIPLLIVGTGAGKLMPKPGPWMDSIKTVFGIMTLAVAIWMISRIVDENIVMLLWSLLAMFTATIIGAFEIRQNSSCVVCYGARKSIGVMIALYASVLFIGALTDASTILNPLEKIISSESSAGKKQSSSNEINFIKIHSISELDDLINRSKGKKIMLDFSAQWCASCKELEAMTFSDEKVKRELSSYLLIQADITKNTKQEQELSKRFNIFGPPALIFFDKSGNEIRKERVNGFISASKLSEKLKKLREEDIAL